MDNDRAFMPSHTFLLKSVKPFGEGPCQPGVSSAPWRSDAAEPAAEDCVCSIAVFTEEPGTIDLDGTSVSLSKGSAIQLRSGGRFSVQSGSGSATGRLAGWLVEFFVFLIGDSRPITGGFPLLPYHQEIAVHPLAALCSIIERLTRTADGYDNPAALRKQAALLELLALLTENQQRSHMPDNAAAAVECAISYVRDHYTEPLTVEQLASIARVGRWQFSELFRRLTGKRPLDYINTIRLNRAKELLLLTDDPLREIAQSVGFRDEYYFNRKFSRMFGCAPKSFARSGKSAASRQPLPPAVKQARGRSSLRGEPSRLVVCGGILGDVLSLGVKPLGAELAVMGRQVVYRDKLAGILDVGIGGDAETIAALQPDLVLLEKEGFAASHFQSGAAPVVSFRRTEDVTVRLRAIAALLGAEREADEWIARHEDAARSMWTRLRSRIGTGETATVLVQIGVQLFAMGNRGLAATLYHPRGFRPSEGAAKLAEGSERFREITAEQLPGYDGDRLFLLYSGDERSKRAARRLTETPAWQSLHAFRSGNIHMAEAKWNYDDSLTRGQLLPVLPHILSSRI